MEGEAIGVFCRSGALAAFYISFTTLLLAYDDPDCGLCLNTGEKREECHELFKLAV
jgi:hypothetical protein